MLNVTIADSRLATECDRRDTEYKKENGCSMEELVQRLWPAGWSTAAGERRDVYKRQHLYRRNYTGRSYHL